jgi:hypothetical protein
MVSNAKLVSIGLLVMGLSACAGVGGGSRGAAVDLRGMAAVQAGSPRLIAAGPVRLLHVDVRGGRAVDLYSAVRQSGTDADCRAAGPAAGARLRRDRRNPIDVDVPDGQVVCLAPVASGTALPAQGIEVSWHARRDGRMPAGTLALDSALASARRAAGDSAGDSDR